MKYLAYSEDFGESIYSFAKELMDNKIHTIFVFGDRSIHKEIIEWRDSYSETLHKEGESYCVITSFFIPKEKCEFYFFIEREGGLKDENLFLFVKSSNDSKYFTALIKDDNVKNKVLFDKKTIIYRQALDLVVLDSPFSYIQNIKHKNYLDKQIDFFVRTGAWNDIYFCKIAEKKGVYVKSGEEIYFYPEGNIIFA